MNTVGYYHSKHSNTIAPLVFSSKSEKFKWKRNDGIYDTQRAEFNLGVVFYVGLKYQSMGVCTLLNGGEQSLLT